MNEIMLNYRGFYITACEDVSPNEGGYYCQVYDDEDMNYEVDNFVVRNGEDWEEMAKAHIDIELNKLFLNK